MQALICDLDRTLVFRPGMDQLYLAEVSRLGVDPKLARQRWYNSHGTPMLMQLVQMGVAQSSAIHFCEELFLRCESLPAQALPGAGRLLMTARALGMQVCVSTGSGQALVEHTLGQTGLLDYVDLPLGSEPGRLKGVDHMRILQDTYPHVSFYLSWMIGDGVKDMQIASEHHIGHKVGVALEGIGGCTPRDLIQAGADWVADSLEDVEAALVRS